MFVSVCVTNSAKKAHFSEIFIRALLLKCFRE